MGSPLFVLALAVAGFIASATGRRVLYEPPPSWVDMKECKRECDGLPKKCYMQMTVERYTVLGPGCGNCTEGVKEDCFNPECITADGYKRSIITVNRQMPGPPIEVCYQDEILVDVVNMLAEEVTSIHWHGIRQIGTPYADGAAYVTQCPIMTTTTFRYRFKPDSPGTFWYHSHTGVQKLDGLSGPLIVRDLKQNEPHGDLYDEDLSDHVIFLKDWTHVPGEDMVMGLHSDKITQMPTSLLINGRSDYYKKDGKIDLPLEEFVVSKGKRYRFRIIGATCMSCAVKVQFEGHRVTAIATDGGLNFKPTVVDSIFLNPGERFDVVLYANNTEGTYKITFQTVGPSCDPKMIQTAILRYENSHSQEDMLEPHYIDQDSSVSLNDIYSKCDGTEDTNICVTQLTGLSDAPKIKSPDLYEQIDLNLNVRLLTLEDVTKHGEFHPYDEPFKGLYQTFLINNVTFAFPPSPVMTQPDDIPSSIFCSEECKKGTSPTPCECALAYELKQDSVVDFILIGGDITFAHPFHFHGYNFYVMEMGTFKDQEKELADLKERLRNDKISTSLRPQKETINVPVQGYAAVRFTADNPGLWMFHCHFAYHLGGGMVGIFRVGQPSDAPPVPEGFPKCGNYMPLVV